MKQLSVFYLEAPLGKGFFNTLIEEAKKKSETKKNDEGE